jgi:GT2 family glycosyltransferase
MDQIEDTKGQWGCHVQNILSKETELVVINNGSTDGTVEFLNRFVFPYFPDHKIVTNPENIGVVASMQQAITESKGDVIAILHNDLYVLQEGWDSIVKYYFEQSPKLGLAGFLGAQGIHQNGGRMNTVSNLLEAEIHGMRISEPMLVSHFDGMALIGRREMFEKVGGFDQNYIYHHFYDRDISLASHYAGYDNLLIPVFSHHRSGVTANRAQYQTWIDGKMGTQGFTGDKASYDASERYFFTKWAGKLPVMIT